MNIKDLETDILGLSDQRLSLITNRAAIEFDNAARGEPIGFASSKRLFSFLRSRIGGDNANVSDPNRTDILTVGLVGESLLDISKDKQKTSLSEIVGEILRLGRSIESAEKTGNNTKALEELRNFCIALNKRIIAERDTLNSNFPPNPYKH